MSERHEENSERAARWTSHQKSNPVPAPSVVEEPGQFPELGPAVVEDPLCEGCYKSPCVCLPDDCNVDPE